VKLAETYKTNRSQFVDDAHVLLSQREKALYIHYLFKIFYKDLKGLYLYQIPITVALDKCSTWFNNKKISAYSIPDDDKEE
jgi:hypothetical protein